MFARDADRGPAPRRGSSEELEREAYTRIPLSISIRAALLAAALSLVTAASAAAGLPRLGAAPDAVNLRSVPGTSAYGSGHQVPVRSARPAW